MARFDLPKTLMGATLVAILLSFTQTEGCGRRVVMIESLSFSSDDTLLLVAKLNARDAETPMKVYIADVSRTISWLEASTGAARELLHQDLRAGNCGPAFELWRGGRTSVICNPSNDHVYMTEFGGGDFILELSDGQSHATPIPRWACNIACSNSGRLLAASGRDEVSVLEPSKGRIVMQIPMDCLPFLSASLMSFSLDETRLLIAGGTTLNVWDIATSKMISTVAVDREARTNGIVAIDGDHVIVCSDYAVRRFDFAGRMAADLANKRGGRCAVSRRGGVLAVTHDDEVSIYDLETNDLTRTLSIKYASALALSSKGDSLAIGDGSGSVTLLDLTNGKQVWKTSPPGRYRWPSTLPAVSLFVWVCLAWLMARNRSRVDVARNAIG